jgi:hypothetical protein
MQGQSAVEFPRGLFHEAFQVKSQVKPQVKSKLSQGSDAK